LETSAKIFFSIFLLFLFSLGLFRVLLALTIVNNKARVWFLDLSGVKKLSLWVAGLPFLKRFDLSPNNIPHFSRAQRVRKVLYLSAYAVLYIGISIYGFTAVFAH
jgi:hypothetical protein